MSIDKVLRKLKLLGCEIKEYNDFGVIYTERDELKLIKLTEFNGEVKQEKISGFDEYGVSKHFIEILQHGGWNLYRLYVKNLKEHVIDLSGKIAEPIFNTGRVSVNGQRITGDTDALMYSIYDFTSGNKLTLVNYEGKQLDITDPVKYNNDSMLSIEKQPDGNYIVGYGKIAPECGKIYKWATRITDAVWIIDKEFKHISRLSKP